MASNRAIIAQCFNKKLDEFLADLISVFPEDSDFRTFKNSFNVLKNIDERKGISMYVQYVAPFREAIRTRDERFFLSTDYNDIAGNNNVSELVDKLKGLWVQMNADNKESVWKYIEVFAALGDRFAATGI
jgi:hypothetical protein